MFSDLVGSRALSARMTLRTLREVISAYQKCELEDLGARDLKGIAGRWVPGRSDILPTKSRQKIKA
jgi:hypothetical protein